MEEKRKMGKVGDVEKVEGRKEKWWQSEDVQQ